MLWRKALTYWRSLVITLLIAYGCLVRQPLHTFPPIEHGDKWSHYAAFMLLTLCILWDSHQATVTPWKKWTLAILYPIAYGGISELLQSKYFYPRIGEWADWLADCIGVLIASLIGLIIQKWHEHRMAQ